MNADAVGALPEDSNRVGELTAQSSLADWLLHLERLHPKGQAGIELGLDRVARVKAALGQTAFCPVITVAGTNGKGSSCAYLESILCFAGYRVGCYASPHLLAYNERVRLDRLSASDAALTAAFAKVEVARRTAGIGNSAVALTYFEFGTLAAWEVFAAAEVDAVVLEVGLGGRLDAVNIYDADVAIVTTVALDHTDWLGPTREEIGFEKAGVFRSGRPALCADVAPPQRLLDHAAAIGADLQLIGRDFGYQRNEGDRQQWQWWCRQQDKVQKRSLAYPGLRGAAQLANASVALAALENLATQLPVPMQAIRRGLIETELAGRFQVLPGRPAIVLDVGHNPQALAVLADNLGSMGFFEATHAVVGMLSDKDALASLAALRGKVDHWHLATLDGVRGAPAERLAAIVANAELGGTVSCYPDPEQAMRAAQGLARESDRILAFGSFLTVAGAMHALAHRR